jgi:hypothetical protein
MADIHLPDDIANGLTSIVFAHPEDLLSDVGRQLMRSVVYQQCCKITVQKGINYK